MPYLYKSDTIPVAPLKIISMESFRPLAEKVNMLIVNARQAYLEEQMNTKVQHKRKEHMDSLAVLGYDTDNYLVKSSVPRFGSGEAKGIIHESIHGKDLFILADVVNYSRNYKLHRLDNPMSPDDQFQDLKRMIDACNGKASRINIIIPFLYGGRQNIRTNLESLDCACALQELTSMGVTNIITFDAHDLRVQNAIPLHGFDNFYTSYQFIQALLQKEDDLNIDAKHLVIVSPDETGMNRAVYYANILGVDMGMFYKRYTYHLSMKDKESGSLEFLGPSVEGRDILIVDDIISTGDRVLAIAKELKKRNASKIFITATYGLFTEGYEKFDSYYKEGIINRVYTTNLTYISPELMEKPFYTHVDVSRYLALIIHTLNHDRSLEKILYSTNRINELLEEYKKVHE